MANWLIHEIFILNFLAKLLLASIGERDTVEWRPLTLARDDDNLLPQQLQLAVEAVLKMATSLNFSIHSVAMALIVDYDIFWGQF